MRPLVVLAIKSLWNRRLTALLTALAVALSVVLILGVERIHQAAQSSFMGSVAQTDLVVGARTSPLQLLLFSVFRIGNPTNSISVKTWKHIDSLPEVKWTVPLSLGDSHRGYPVVATNDSYLEHLRFRQSESLSFVGGRWFEALHEVVIGAEVADQLNYSLGDKVVVSHGTGDVTFTHHDEHPFKVVGILRRTGTPVDRSLHISLEAMEALHHEEEEHPGHSHGHSHDHHHHHHDHHDHSAQKISAFLVGLESPRALLLLQRQISEYEAEPLTAVIPGRALQQLWQGLEIVHNTLRLIGALVLGVSLLAMLLVLLSTLNERRREMAILRALGASPWAVMGLLLFEALLLALSGVVLGGALLALGLVGLKPWLEAKMGLSLHFGGIASGEWMILVVILLAALVVAFLPAYQAYRRSLADGLRVSL